jgi:N-acetylglucosaminyldiphosphoundecaprenol N-acetyl-beta-D-mannosaminyltransferase
MHSYTDRSIQFINILGIPIVDFNLQITQNLIGKLEENSKKCLCISATGAHGLIETTKNALFAEALKGFYWNLPDGMPLVWLGRFKGAMNIQRCYGPDFFSKVIIETKLLKVNHFFCGGNQGVADELRKVCLNKYGNNNVSGTYCPPFLDVDKYNYSEISDIINKTDTNILWIGLSTPKQELFAYYLSKYVNVDFIICVGAAFDFHTGKIKQAPNNIQKIGLEWLYRLCMEPKRLYRRYLEIVPKFIIYNILEFLRIKTF